MGDAPDVAFLSQDHDLFSGTVDLALDPADADPPLGPPADYGGTTEARALRPGGPVTEVGDTVAAVTAEPRAGAAVLTDARPSRKIRAGAGGGRRRGSAKDRSVTPLPADPGWIEGSVKGG